MAAIPAEASRPTRRFSGPESGGPLWTAIGVALFSVGLYLLTWCLLAAAELAGGSSAKQALPLQYLLSGALVGALLVFGQLYVLASHSRTRSSTADYSFAAMKAIMLLAGVVLLIGGALDLFDTASSEEEVAEGLLSALYIATSISLHLVGR